MSRCVTQSEEVGFFISTNLILQNLEGRLQKKIDTEETYYDDPILKKICLIREAQNQVRGNRNREVFKYWINRMREIEVHIDLK
jgi:hypothetical protein